MFPNETLMSFNSADVTEHVSVKPVSEEVLGMLEFYLYFTQIIGLLIIVANLSVVVTSGLILKKATTVQPKSTYMLLGNISLADTILGVTMVFTSYSDKSIREVSHLQDELHTVCMVLQGLRMCPAVVSILSVGFIAADRYIYLLHGLYYKTWVSARRVRIAIVCIWIMGTIFTIPGWVNINKISRCYFIDIYPIEQMLTMAAMSFSVIAAVTTIYTIILLKAIKANNKIKKAKKIAQDSVRDRTNSTDASSSESTSTQCVNNDIYLQQTMTLTDANLQILDVKSLELVKQSSVDGNQNFVDMDPKPHASHNDEIVLTLREDNSTDAKINDAPNNSSLNRSVSSFVDVNKVQSKRQEKKKRRAITVVILTTCSFIITWVPFIVTMVYFGYICKIIHDKEYCELSCQKLVRPLWGLALLNSLLNPFIYAWWHKGFKEFVRTCYKKCFRKVV